MSRSPPTSRPAVKAAPRGSPLNLSPSPSRSPAALSLCSSASVVKIPPHALHGAPSPESRRSRTRTLSPEKRSYVKSPTRLSGMKQQKESQPVDRLPIGSAVERNPAFWKYGDQDGGEGSIGIVTADDPTNGYVCVLWSGNVTRNYYKYGLHSEFDVMRSTRFDITGFLYFNSPVSSFIDPGALGDCIRCDVSEHFAIPLALTTISFLSTHEHNIVGVKFVLKRDSDKHELRGLSGFVASKTLQLDRSLQVNLDKSYIKNRNEPITTTKNSPPPKPRFSVPASRQNTSPSQAQVSDSAMAHMPPSQAVELPQMVTKIDVISRVSPNPRLYQLTLRGDITQMPVAAIKKSLEAHTGVPSTVQVLEKEGYVLYDNLTGSAVGLKSGSVLTLRLGNEGTTPTKSYYVAEAAQISGPGSPTATWAVGVTGRRSVSPPRR